MTVVLHGAPNFRDVGGQPAWSGRRVRHGSVLRCGHLGELHDDDIALLQKHLGGDIWVVDLRGANERTKYPCLLPDAVVHSLPIEPSVAQKLDALGVTGEPMTAAAAQRFMCEAYVGFARNAKPQLAQLMQHAIAREGRPLLVHCAAGKDRTGFMIAMLLSALGVPRDAVMDDYLLTNQRVAPREGGRYPAEIMQVLRTVRAEYLEAAFDAIEREAGGMDAYLAQAAALTPQGREALRQALLTS